MIVDVFFNIVSVLLISSNVDNVSFQTLGIKTMLNY